ncbi:MAG: isochorismate synthase [Chloroflexota bacterium]
MTAVRPPASAGPASAGAASAGPASAGAASAGPADQRDDGLAERLHRLLVGAGSGAPTLVAATIEVPVADPIAVYAAAVEADLEAALWLQPSEGTAYVGIGRAWAVEPEGPDRFDAAASAWQALISDASIDGPPSRYGGGPVLLGGLGFNGRRPDQADVWGPFGPASLVLPELLLAVTPNGSSVTGSLFADAVGPWSAGSLEHRWERLADRARSLAPNPAGIIVRPVVAPLVIVAEQPAREAWRRLVGMFAGAVGRGRLDKVVLARRVDFRASVELDVPNAVRRLALSAPESTTYAFRREGRTFIGATPERLVRTEGHDFRTVAVGGSIRRGADAAEDAVLAQALLDSEKNREEHAIVVAALEQLLAPVAERLEVAPGPGVMTLRHIQHLVTEVTGTVREAHGLLALAGRLHPTPAVGGEPRALALSLIDEHEGFDRGWYAGPVGWLGADGDGELCVALRCGIVDRTRATLFAGCGIVADSDPDQEWEESRIKLRAVAAALGRLEDET